VTALRDSEKLENAPDSQEARMSWSDPDREDKTIYKVVVNHEEQYSIWPADRENPSAGGT
jgi:hypothetical protein